MTAPALPIVIATIDKNKSERFRVAIDQFRGTTIIDARVWLRDGDNWKPTRAGISTAIRHLPALAKALNDAVEQARDAGMLD